MQSLIDIIRDIDLEFLAAAQFTAVLGTALALLLIAHILRSPRTPSASIGWIIVIITMPLVGIPLYLTFGQRKLRAKINHKAKINTGHGAVVHPDPIDAILTSLGLPPGTGGNEVTFDADGRQAFDSVLETIENASRTIDIAMFILKNDATGQRILRALQDRAANGVKVRLLLDGVGSFSLSKRWLKPAMAAGVDIAWFIPVLHHPLRGKTNLRNHRKILIADGTTLWSGGRNFAAEYLGPDCPADCWIDLSYRLQGPSVAVFAGIFETDWQFAQGVDLPLPLEDVPTPYPEGGRVQVIPSGPDVEGDPIYAALLTSCYTAQKRIIIVTPYYVPDQGLQEALKLAALRGVTVDLVLPEKSNHKLADIARRRFLRELAGAGVNIWLLPDYMVHAKAMVVDGTFAMAGSANLDIRSLFLNCEVISGFYSPPEIAWLGTWCEGLRDRSRHHAPAQVGTVAQTIEGLVLLTGYQL